MVTTQLSFLQLLWGIKLLKDDSLSQNFVTIYLY
jgi:hypothetical protein